VLCSVYALLGRKHQIYVHQLLPNALIPCVVSVAFLPVNAHLAKHMNMTKTNKNSIFHKAACVVSGVSNISVTDKILHSKVTSSDKHN